MEIEHMILDDLRTKKIGMAWACTMNRQSVNSKTNI